MKILINVLMVFVIGLFLNAGSAFLYPATLPANTTAPPWLWLDANDQSTLSNVDGSALATNGGQVSVWMDKSGNNNKSSFFNGRAKYLSNFAPGGRGVLSFANDSSYQTSLNFGYNYGTVFMIFNATNTAFSYLLSGMSNSWTNSVYLNVGNLFKRNGTEGAQDTGLDYLANTYYCLTYRYTNGVQYYSLNNGTASVYNNSTAKIEKWRIAENISGGSRFRGYIGEVLIYNEMLAIDETDAVHQYLGSKWGLVPTAPTGLTVTATNNRSVSLSWVDNSDSESGFEIWGQESGSTNKWMATVGPNIISCIIKDLKASSDYTFFVRSLGLGKSSFSSSPIVRTKQDPPPPSGTTVPPWLWLDANAPKTFSNANKTALATNNGAVSMWLDRSGRGDNVLRRVGYGIFLSNRTPNGNSVLKFTNATSFSNLTPLNSSAGSVFVLYNHQVTNNDIIISSKSNIGTASYYLNLGSEKGRVLKKHGTEATVTTSLTFSTNTYNVLAYRFTNGSQLLSLNGGTSLSYSLATTAKFREFRIGESIGNGSAIFGEIGEILIYDKMLTATETDAVHQYLGSKWGLVPTAPTGLTVTATNNRSVSLSWVDNSDSESGFEIWGQESGSTNKLLATVGANVINSTINGLIASTDYTFSVRSLGLGKSSFSSSPSVRTTPDPLPPVGTTASPWLWLDADDPSTLSNYNSTALATNNGAVRVWRDKSPRGDNFIRRTAGSAVWFSNYTVGGKGVLNFTNHPSYSNQTLFNCSSGSVFILFNHKDNVNSDIIFSTKSNSGSPTYYLNIAAQNGKIQKKHGTESTITTSLSFTTNTYNVVTYQFTNGAQSLRLNGGVPLNYNVSTTAVYKEIRIGESIGGGSAFTGQLGEVLVYNRVLTATETDSVHQYLGNKWNLVPDAPTGLVITATNSRSLTLSWIDNASSESGYEIWSSVSDSDSVLHSTTTANATSLIVTNLQPEKGYSFKVRSIGLGKSSFTSSLSVTTLKDPRPRGISLAPLLWLDADDPGAFSNVARNALSTNNGAVSVWVDKSYRKDNAIRKSAGYGIYKKSLSTTERSALLCTNSSSFGTALPFGRGFGSVFIVFNPKNKTDADVIFPSKTNVSTPSYYLNLSLQSGTIRKKHGTEPTIDTAIPYETNVYQILSYLFTNGFQKVLLNGKNQKTYNVTGDALFREFRIGENIAGGSAYTGSLGEVLVFDRVLSEEETQEVNFYLDLKWKAGTFNMDNAPLIKNLSDNSPIEKNFPVVLHSYATGLADEVVFRFNETSMTPLTNVLSSTTVTAPENIFNFNFGVTLTTPYGEVSQTLQNLNLTKSPSSLSFVISDEKVIRNIEEQGYRVRVEKMYDYSLTTRVSILSVDGKTISTLYDGKQVDKTLDLVWFGKDDKGNRVPSGIYFISRKLITMGASEEERTLVVLIR